MKRTYELKPYKNGDWAVYGYNQIELTCADSNGEREYLAQSYIALIGSLKQCEEFMNTKDNLRDQINGKL